MPSGNLHQIAVDVTAGLDQLSTGLAQAGADPGAVETVSKMGEVMRKIVKALGQGQEQTGDTQPPAPQPQPTHTLDSATADLHQQAQARAAMQR